VYVPVFFRFYFLPLSSNFLSFFSKRSFFFSSVIYSGTISGRAGAEFANFTYLEYLQLNLHSSSEWELELVEELFELSSLIRIFVEKVDIVTPLPSTFSTSALEYVKIDECGMRGTLPESLPDNLIRLELRENELEGEIPLSW